MIKARGKLKKEVLLEVIKDAGVDEETVTKAEQNLQLILVPGKDSCFELAWGMELPIGGRKRWLAFRPEFFDWVDSDDLVEQDETEDDDAGK